MRSNELGWLQRTVVAVREVDVMDLAAWNREAPNYPDIDWDSLRSIIGKISTRLNEISSIYKNGIRNYSPEMASEAQRAVDDLRNEWMLQHTLAETLKLIQSDSSPQSQMMQNMVYSVSQMNFTPEQVSQLEQMAQGAGSSPQILEEVNVGKLQDFLQRAIYSTKDPSERTLKVFREVLQNAGDAALTMKSRNPEHVPTIEVFTQVYSDEKGNYLDAMIKDNGIGMDWATLSQKFFIYFQSGKEDDEAATGGFGIAKAVIQESPEHGWTVDTNGIHASRFSKNIYMSGQPFEPARTSVAQWGTSMTLYKLPDASEYEIIDLCKKFASEDLQIFFNGKQVEPLFRISELVPVGSDTSQLVDAIAETNIEKIIADVIIKSNPDIVSQLGDLEYPTTKINFYIKPTKYSGEVHVLLNGQHQFKNNYIAGADIVVAIQTTARPGSEEYPVDPGRDNLRSNFKDDTASVVSALKELLDEIKDNELFKEGLDIVVYNESEAPLKTHADFEDESEVEVAEKKQRMKWLLHQKIQGTTAPNLFPKEEVSDPDTPVGDPSAPPDINQLRVEAQQKNVDVKALAMMHAAVEVINRENQDSVKVTQNIDHFIEGLTSPLVISIQRNFVSRDIAHEDPTLTANLSLLWHAVLKMVVDHTDYMIPSYDQKTYSPGFIYSDKAVALYSPPKETKFSVISINPVVIASVVHPAAFKKHLSGSKDSNAFQEEYDGPDLTPTKRLTSLLFHSAVHEVTHLYFPDYYGYENFHSNITRMEKSCHELYGDIRTEVKRYMPGLKKESLRLIRAIRDNKTNQLPETTGKANWLIKIA